MSCKGVGRDLALVFMPIDMPEKVRLVLEPVLSFRAVSAVEICDTIREALALMMDAEGR